MACAHIFGSAIWVLAELACETILEEGEVYAISTAHVSDRRIQTRMRDGNIGSVVAGSY